MSQPTPCQPPYSAAECARMLGCSAAGFRRAYRRLVTHDSMPRSLVSGRYVFERSGFDHWLTRHHPARAAVARAANDAAPPLSPDDEEARARVLEYYR